MGKGEGVIESPSLGQCQLRHYAMWMKLDRSSVLFHWIAVFCELAIVLL